MTGRQRLLVAMGLLISAVFLWVAFAGLNPQDVLSSIREVNGLLLLAGGTLYYLAMLVITWRWQFLLRALVVVRLRALYGLVAIGYMGNNVYPFRSGEVLRVLLLFRDHQVPLARGTTTVLVERVFDGVVMLTFVLVPLLFLEDFAAPEVRTAAAVAAPVFGVALLVFLLMAANPGLLRRIVVLIARPLPQRLAALMTTLSEDVIAGLAGLRSARDLIGAVFASYLTWMVEALVYWLVAFAFGLDLSYLLMLVTVGAVNLAGLIPASPGQLGVFEFFVSRVLIAAGVAEAQATAYALLVHLVIWLPPTLLGFVILVRRGLGLGALAHAHDQAEQVGTVSPEAQPPR